MTLSPVTHSLHGPTLAIRLDAALELLKPLTWFPPMWAFGCGVVSAGVSLQARWPSALVGIVVAGPLVCAASQATNDWFDREVDALNQPDRPIPSGRIPGHWGLYLAIGWSALSLGVAGLLGPLGWASTALALLLSWAYSAPPLRLKRNGWLGNATVGLAYEGLAWVTGAAVMLQPALPRPVVFWLAAAYSIGAHGIMTLNDFKSIDGDRASGIGSLPVRLGPERAAQLACATMLAAQAAVVLSLAAGGHGGHAALVFLLVLMQCPLMHRFLAAPRQRASWLSGVGVPLYVLGMLVSALAVRGAAA